MRLTVPCSPITIVKLFREVLKKAIGANPWIGIQADTLGDYSSTNGIASMA